jgi:hypothetical protein
MKMAKPSATDIAAAEELQQVLNALDQNQRWGCAALEDTPDFFQLIDDDEFDPEQGRHAQALYNKLVTLMRENPSFHNRVISGMCHVIMYEKNEIIDPDSDCIDLHPRFAEMWNDLKRETQAARYWNKRYHQVVAERDELRAYKEAAENQEPFAWFLDVNFNENIAGPYRTKEKAELAELVVDAEYKKVLPLYAKSVPADNPAEAVPDEVIRTLERIAKWHGEFPEAPPFQGKPQSYGAAYGSNGERDYMRGLAAEALELLRAPSHSQQSAQRISRKDVQEILESFSKWINLDDSSSAITTWDATYEGRELLEKLNAGRCPSHESEQSQ